MNPIHPALWLLIIVCLAGCGTAAPDPSKVAEETRFETRTLVTQKESLRKMIAGMTDDQKKEFINCMVTVARRGHTRSNIDPEGEEFMKPLRGMTRAEIEARAKEIRAEQSSGQEKSPDAINATKKAADNAN